MMGDRQRAFAEYQRLEKQKLKAKENFELDTWRNAIFMQEQIKAEFPDLFTNRGQKPN